MRILHISSEPPGDKSGGQLVVKESLYALKQISEIDYIGPEIDTNEVTKFIENKYYIKPKRSFLGIIKGILTLSLSSYYESFNNKIREIDINSYDLIYMEFSKWLFVAKYIKKNKKRLVIRLHNIEKDYSYNIYKMNKTLKNYLAYLYYSYIERNIIKSADKVIVLTDKDKNKLKNIYKNQINEKDIVVMPVCVKKRSEIQHSIDKKNVNLLVTGSLWYGPNYEGIKWFIEKVWEDVREKCNLYIVGSKPNEELISIVQNDPKIILIQNPEDTKEYFELADIYISPIFNGAGMKVKNAEAMSFALPIVGTNHSFIGYERSINLHYLANTREEFINSINMHINKEKNNIIKQRNNICNDFNNKYNVEECHTYIKNIF